MSDERDFHGSGGSTVPSVAGHDADHDADHDAADDAPPSEDVERAEAAPPGQHEDRETFSGEETIAGVAEELRDKPS